MIPWNSESSPWIATSVPDCYLTCLMPHRIGRNTIRYITGRPRLRVTEVRLSSAVPCNLFIYPNLSRAITSLRVSRLNCLKMLLVQDFTAKNILFFTGLLAILNLGETTRPHIIFLVADDLGWNDVSIHGSPQIRTPNIQNLAKNGITLDNYYACPLCSPSRGAILTGLYPIHTGLQHQVILPNQPWGLPLSLTLLPQYLKKLGYSTHAIGKWNLGNYHKKYTPVYRGFESHYGYWGDKVDYFNHVNQLENMSGIDFRDDLCPVINASGKYSTTMFTDRALKIIGDHDISKPLFLYFCYSAVHNANQADPLQAPAEYMRRFPNIKDKNRRKFAGMVSAMDDSVGSILKSLEARKMLKNAIVVFTSDNGGAAAGMMDNVASNWPLRGVKGSAWEGGVRVPGIIWSPLVEETRVSMDMMHITDWLPTLYHAAGGNVSTLGNIDGHDMLNTLFKNQPSSRKEILLIIDPVDNLSALRVGNYKILQGVSSISGNWSGWYGPSGRDTDNEDNTNFFLEKYSDRSSAEAMCGPKPKDAHTNCQPTVRPCLFDVERDPCEYHNMADQEPEILSYLLKRLADYNRTAVEPGNKPIDPKSDPKYHNNLWTNWKDYED